MLTRSVKLVAGLAASATLLGGGLALAAGAGALDPGFGSDGIAKLGPGTQLFGVAVQQDGDVVSSGTENGAVLVERFTRAGMPDGSFGSGGRALGSSGVGHGVALQPDGKPVVAATGGGLAAERFTKTGASDASFGAGGVARAAALGANAAGNAIALDPGGRIVVAGSLPGSDGFARIALARFNPDGNLDTSFGSGGVQVLDFGPDSAAEGVAIQPDNKIVLVGHQAPGLQVTNALILRLNANGSLDSSFAGNGAFLYYHPGGGGYSSLNAVALQSDGRVVAAGVDLQNSSPRAVFVRLNPDGTPDGAFNGSGVQSLPSGPPGTIGNNPYGAYGVGIASGGRIVAAGNYVNQGPVAAALWALTANGAPDATFGNGGTITTPVNNRADANALAVAPGGGIVTAGDTQPSYPIAGPFNGLVARYEGFGSASAGGGRNRPLSVSFRSLAKSFRLKSILKKGLIVKVRCSDACTIAGSLVISRSAAKKLHVAANRNIVELASGGGTLPRAGTLKLRLRFTKTARRALAKQARVAAQLRVTARTFSGATVSLSRRIVLKR